MTLEKEFEQAMVEAIRESKQHGYYPTRFEEKMERLGAVAYAKELVKSGELQDGLLRLEKMNRLDLSVEHLVANETKFAELFSQEEKDAAKWRLKQVMQSGTVRLYGKKFVFIPWLDPELEEVVLLVEVHEGGQLQKVSLELGQARKEISRILDVLPDTADE